MSSKARRWMGVGTASLSMRTPPANLTVLRVSVARSSRSVARLWAGWVWSAVRLEAAFSFAAGEDVAGATGSVRLEGPRR